MYGPDPYNLIFPPKEARNEVYQAILDYVKATGYWDKIWSYRGSVLSVPYTGIESLPSVRPSDGPRGFVSHQPGTQAHDAQVQVSPDRLSCTLLGPWFWQTPPLARGRGKV